MNGMFKNEKGFTIFEMIIVISIIGVLGAVAWPNLSIVQQSRMRSLSTQITMDLRKMQNEARTNVNKKITDHTGKEVYQYFISFEDGVYYTNEIKLTTSQAISTSPSSITISSNDITTRAMYADADKDVISIKAEHHNSSGSSNDIERIYFDQRGRININDSSNQLEEVQSPSVIKVIIETDKLKREIEVNPLTAKTSFGAIEKK